MRKSIPRRGMRFLLVSAWEVETQYSPPRQGCSKTEGCGRILFLKPGLHRQTSWRSTEAGTAKLLKGKATMKLSFGFLMLLLGSALTSPVPEVTRTEEHPLYPYGINVGDGKNPKEDDGVSPEIPIRTTFNFYGKPYRSLYVNNNGVVSFAEPVPGYTPEAIPLTDGKHFVAPYWGDVDNKLGGDVFYREVTDPELLRQITRDLNKYFPGIRFDATWAFIATWDHVAYFRSSSKKTNTFQCALATDGVISFIILNYGDIQWTTGAASGGNPRTGLGGIPAQAGFNGGDDKNYFSIPNSRTDKIIHINQTTNVNVTGRWVFQVDNGIPEKQIQSIKEAEKANREEEQEQQSNGGAEEESQGNHENEADPEAEGQQEPEPVPSETGDEGKESQGDQANPEAEGQQEKEPEPVPSETGDEGKESQGDKGNPVEEGNASVPVVETPELPVQKPLEENYDDSEESEDCEW